MRRQAAGVDCRLDIENGFEHPDNVSRTTGHTLFSQLNEGALVKHCRRLGLVGPSAGNPPRRLGAACAADAATTAAATAASIVSVRKGRGTWDSR